MSSFRRILPTSPLAVVALVLASVACIACNRGPGPSRDNSREARNAVQLPEDVRRELDAIQELAKATQEEYERLYSTVVFADDEKKRAAAKWHKGRQMAWSIIQLNDIHVRRQGRFASPFEVVMMVGGLDDFIDAEPSVFVETSFYPKVVRKELASFAKLTTLREDYEAAKLRMLKAWLAAEQATMTQPK